MRRALVLVFCLVFSVLHHAAASPCFMSRVQDSSGAILTLNTGFTYQVYPGRDSVAAEFWQPLDHVRVCAYSGGIDQITDLSRPQSISILAVKMMQ